LPREQDVFASNSHLEYAVTIMIVKKKIKTIETTPRMRKQHGRDASRKYGTSAITIEHLRATFSHANCVLSVAEQQYVSSYRLRTHIV
jgi:hypothetical protein